MSAGNRADMRQTLLQLLDDTDKSLRVARPPKLGSKLRASYTASTGRLASAVHMQAHCKGAVAGLTGRAGNFHRKAEITL